MRLTCSDSNMFKKAIEAFYPPIKGKECCSQVSTRFEHIYDFIVLDFELPTSWDFREFSVEESTVISHDKIYKYGNPIKKSFVSRVRLPSWIDYGRANLFTHGLSAVISFCINRPVYPFKDSSLVHSEEVIPIDLFLNNWEECLEETTGLRAYVVDNTGNKHFGRIRSFSPRHEMFSPYLTIMLDNEDNDGKIKCVFVQIDDSRKVTEINKQDIDFKIQEIEIVSLHKGIYEIACLLSVITAGPSMGVWDVHDDVLDLWKNGISEIISNLYKLDFDCLPRVGKKKYDKHIDFQKGMQVIRLINLAHQSYINDFDLAFSLVVAAIEAIAQIAVKTEDIPDILNEEEHFKDDVNPKHQDYNEWKKCKEYYGEFLDHYKQLKRFVEENHKNRELKKRFQGFILKYCPLSEWEIKEESKYSLLNGIDDLNTIKTIRNVLEDRPIDFPGDIFRDTYNYRSKYFHAGKHTDHNMPTCQIFSRFFQQIINPMKKEKFDDFIKERSGDSIPEKELEEFYLYLLTYDAISMIARKSISNYISEYLRINQD